MRAKKSLGQHFLKDQQIAKRIVESLTLHGNYKHVLEIGPGLGVLTQFLFEKKEFETTIIELDHEAIAHLKKKFHLYINHIHEGDFLKVELKNLFGEPFGVIGNFPYNISSQILFKILDYKEMVPEVVGMFQKEVGVRIASQPGNRDYGILSVLMQAYYDVELLFLLDENDFTPPPKVKSAVLRFQRKEKLKLNCNEEAFKRVVKVAFNQRRKTLRNALSQLFEKKDAGYIPYLDQRAETLGWHQFVELTNALEDRK